MCTPARIDLDRHLQQGVEVGAGVDEVLADDDEGRAGHAGLDELMLRLSSLHVSCSSQPVGEDGRRWICHWPKTRMISTSPSEHRTKSCWSLTVNATSPSLSMFGARPEVDEHVEDPAAQRVLVRRRGKLGSDVGSVMGPT